jgi:anti-sigma B factor antagonist
MTMLTVAASPDVEWGIRTGESLTVALCGELDIATVPQLDTFLEVHVHEGVRRLVVDVSGLAFVDARGLRAFTAMWARAEQRGIAVVVSGVPPQMRRLMDVVQPPRRRML